MDSGKALQLASFLAVNTAELTTYLYSLADEDNPSVPEMENTRKAVGRVIEACRKVLAALPAQTPAVAPLFIHGPGGDFTRDYPACNETGPAMESDDQRRLTEARRVDLLAAVPGLDGAA